MKKFILSILVLALLVVVSCTPENLSKDAKLIDKDDVESPGGDNDGE